MAGQSDLTATLLATGAVAIAPPSASTDRADLGDAVSARPTALSTDRRVRTRVLEEIAARVSELSTSPDAVAGLGTSSLFLTSLVAHHLRLPMVYIRPRPKSHGKGKQIEGQLRGGQRVLLIASQFRSGSLLRDALRVVAAEGAHVVAGVSLVSAASDEGAAVAREYNIRWVSLVDAHAASELVSTGAGGDRAASTKAAAPAPPSLLDQPRPVPGKIERNKRRVAQILLEIGAVVVRPSPPFVYASGLHGPIYTDCRLLISHPRNWQEIVDCFVDLLAERVGLADFDVLSGSATAGIPHAALIADRLDRPMIYVTFEEGDERGRIEGDRFAGQRVVMIEDHVTTGGAVVKATRTLREYGARINHCLAIFQYDRPGGHAVLHEAGIRLSTLCDLTTLLEVGFERGAFDAAARDAVIEWNQDPKGWTARDLARPG